MDRVYDSSNRELYSTWHYEDGGIVEIVLPSDHKGSIRMSLAKAEDLAASIAKDV